MMKYYLFSLLFAASLFSFSQNNQLPKNNFQQEFAFAYQQYPDVPKGVLEAVAYTMTRFHHIKNPIGSCIGLPKTYGVMGLTLDGKNYFKNNLLYVAQISGISINDILNSPQQNILAFAAAYHHELTSLNPSQYQGKNMASILTKLSELPDNGLQQDFALNSHLYSVLSFLNDVTMQQTYNFPNPHLNLKKVFGVENLKVLQSSKIKIAKNGIRGDNGVSYKKGPHNKSVDYPPAIWSAADPSNYSSRGGTAISAITIHDIEGTYSGAISWFKNPSANVSAHYVLRSSDGQVTQMVLESDKAWHVGSENSYTIGFEHEGYATQTGWYTTAMYVSSANLARDITQSGYGINPLRVAYFPWTATTLYNASSIPGSCVTIKGHQHYPNQTHTDPGANWDWKLYDDLINNTTPFTVITSSSGTITDNGGSTGNYGNDERQLIRIKPTNASTITLTTIQFNIENTWDYLYIYDGDSSNAPLIGIYTGTTIPATITSTGGSISLEFRSDCATTLAGFEFNYTATTPDMISPTTAVNAPTGWLTANFTANFTDADNTGGSGLEKSYYQVIDFDGTEWRANANNGFFADNFNTAIHPDWKPLVGNWSINANALYQSDEVASNTNISAFLSQSLSNRYLYHFQAKINGTGTNRRAGFHFFASDTLSNRGNSYFVWFRVDNAKLQIYKVVNNVFGSPVLDMPFTTVAGQLYDYKIIYDRITGKISVFRDDIFITSWTDSSPISTGNYISFRSGNATLSVNQLKIYRSRNASVTVSVGAAATNDIRYQNPNPSTPSGKVKSIVVDSANNISTIAQQLINVDWTPPTNFTINDGTANDVDTTFNTTQLDANWNAASDPNSLVASYWYAIGTTAGDSDAVAWTNNATTTTFSKTGLSLNFNQDYYVSVRAKNGAGLTTNITADGIWVILATSIKNNSSLTFTAYPNPFNQNITINLKTKEAVELTLFDVNGKLIFTKFSANKNNIILNMAHFNLRAGNYFLIIKGKNAKETLRLIKN